jgi:hypothetical protein
MMPLFWWQITPVASPQNARTPVVPRLSGTPA